MASAHTDSMPLGQSAQVPDHRPKRVSLRQGMRIEMPSGPASDLEQDANEGRPAPDDNEQLLFLEDNCEKSHDGADAMITMDSTTKIAGLNVAPFLAKHIPEQYAPLGAPTSTTQTRKDPNTKYCYRHRPDSKCRRMADEPTMDKLQRVRTRRTHIVGMANRI